MSLRLLIRHETGFAFPEPARASYEEARLTPLTQSGQTVLATRLDITPSPAVQRYRDYWGSMVTAFDLHEPHEELRLVATSTVLVDRRTPPGQQLTWEHLIDRGLVDRMCEYLELPARVAPSEELLEEVHARLGGLTTPREFVTEIGDLVWDRLDHDAGPTTPAPTAAEIWESGRGRSLDFAHVVLGALRAAGVPSRYVWGYVHPQAEPLVHAPAEVGRHAWVEWWDGTWVGVDPTLQSTPDDRYVVMCTGRDDDDVAPLRGIHAGGGAAELFAGVTLTRVE